MKALAFGVLNIPYMNETEFASGAEDEFARKVFAKMFAMPSGAMPSGTILSGATTRLKSRLQEFHTSEPRSSDLEVEDVD